MPDELAISAARRALPGQQNLRQITVAEAEQMITSNILTCGAAQLEQVAQPVFAFDDELQQQIFALHRALTAYRSQTGYGRGIAAPQLGLGVRLIVLDLGAGPIALVNPEITWRSAELDWVWDDCLSEPEIIVRVQRHRSISLRYQDSRGRWRHWQRLPGDLAELVQHELDHLAGVLMSSYIRSEADWRPLSERERLIGQARPRRRLQVQAVLDAVKMIPAEFQNSPQYVSEELSRLLGCQLTVKLEMLNPLRSFKGRGASYRLARLAQAGDPALLVAASAGNWGQALAYECRRRAWPVVIFAAAQANPHKLERMRALGAELRLVGEDFDAAKLAAKAYAKAVGACFLEDGEDPEVSEGHATLARELLQPDTQYDAILAPLGNGALLNGIGLWTKAVDPAVAIIGVCARGAPCMDESWRSGRPVSHVQIDTIADGIGVRIPIAAALADMDGLVDDVVQVSDANIVAAMRLAQQHLSVMLEPAGAAALAAVLEYPQRFIGQRLALILTGACLSEQQRQLF